MKFKKNKVKKEDNHNIIKHHNENVKRKKEINERIKSTEFKTVIKKNIEAKLDKYIISDIKKHLKDKQLIKRNAELNKVNFDQYNFLKHKNLNNLHNQKSIDNYSNLNFFGNRELFFEVLNEKISKIENEREQIIKEESIIFIVWNLLISVILMQIMLLFPFEISEPDQFDSNEDQIRMNVIFEGIFLTDIVINFFTAYYDKYNNIITNKQQIALKQICSWFAIDLFSSIPTYSLIQFKIQRSNLKNNQVKLLKLPKQLRQINIIKKFNSLKLYFLEDLAFHSKIYDTLYKMQQFSKNIVIFLIMSNFLVCIMVSVVKKCPIEDINFIPDCRVKNWFRESLWSEYELSLIDPDNIQHQIAVKIASWHPGDEEAQLGAFYTVIVNHSRLTVQIQGYQQIIQTLTTVGYGDIAPYGINEMVLRLICQVVGVLLFSFISSTALESIVSDTIDNRRFSDRKNKVDRIVTKYSLINEPRRIINYLTDNINKLDMSQEQNLINKLPKRMAKLVLEDISNIYTHKFNILTGESTEFFEDLQQICSFRQCIFNEFIAKDNESHYSNIFQLVQSGKVACSIIGTISSDPSDNIKFLNVGDDFCQTGLLNTKDSLLTYQCDQESEIIEIRFTEYLKLFKQHAIKAKNQVTHKLREAILELQIISSLMQIKIVNGQQTDQRKQNMISAILHLKSEDQKVIEKIVSCQLDPKAYIDKSSFNDEIFSWMEWEKQHQRNKWQFDYLTLDLYKELIYKITCNLTNQVNKDFFEFLNIRNDKFTELSHLNRRESIRNSIYSKVFK